MAQHDVDEFEKELLTSSGSMMDLLAADDVPDSECHIITTGTGDDKRTVRFLKDAMQEKILTK